MAFKRFSFTKNWTHAEDFPTVESDESRVRADMQALHDEAKEGLNYLQQELENSSAASNLGAIDHEGKKSTIQKVLAHILQYLSNMFGGITKIEKTLTVDDTAIPTSKAVNDAIQTAGNLPVGGSVGQVLAKSSVANYETRWQDSVRNGLNLIAKFTQPGAYEWVCPEAGKYFVMIMGGGGGGAVAFYTDPSVQVGGASGYVRYLVFDSAAGARSALVVGAGGKGATRTHISGSPVNTTKDTDGGASSFDGHYANGGGCGSRITFNGDLFGSQNPSRYGYSAHGGNFSYHDSYPSGGEVEFSDAVALLLPDETGLPITCYCAGACSSQKGVHLPNGEKIPDGASPSCTIDSYGDVEFNFSMAPSSDCGAGGSAVSVNKNGAHASNYDAFGEVKGGDGADGGVFIYKLTGGNV